MEEEKTEETKKKKTKDKKGRKGKKLQVLQSERVIEHIEGSYKIESQFNF